MDILDQISAKRMKVSASTLRRTLTPLFKRSDEESQ